MLNLQDVEHYLDNLHRTQSVLDRVISEAGTQGVYLVDDNGFLVAEAGEIEIDRVTLSALVAASFEATREIARLCGETDFSRLIHQGNRRHLFIGRAGERHILIILFGSETNLGLVKLYAEQAAKRLGTLLDTPPEESEEMPEEAVQAQDSGEQSGAVAQMGHNDDTSSRR